MARSHSGAGAAADLEVVITRVFPAERRVVFQAWDEPLRVAQWWGPAGFTATDVQLDARPGGVWRIGMRSREGQEQWARGTYREIVAPELLVLTWVWENPAGQPGQDTLLEVSFVERHRHTELTLRHGVFSSAQDRDLHREGWEECLDRLRLFLANAQ